MFDKIKEMDIVAKMSIIGLVAAVFIAIIIGIVVLVMNQNEEGSNGDSTAETIESTTVNEEEKVKSYNRIVAVVQEVDTESNTLKLYDFDDNRSITLMIDGTVSMKNEYGAEITFAQLTKGDIIESKYDVNSLKPEDIKISANSWERKNVTDIIVDSQTKTIRIGSDIYNYNDQLVTVRNGEDFFLEDLDPVDKLTIKGYQDHLLTIDLQSGHGVITLVNHNKYVGGIMEVDKTTYDIEAETSVTVPAGVQGVIISHENYTSIVKKIMVAENEESIIDLGDIVADNTIVNFIITQSDAQLYINDELQALTEEPITLEYGEYAIRVEKEEFTTWEGVLIANEPYMNFEIDMEERLILVNIADPEGYSLFIGTDYLGEIPVTVSLEEGNHTITIRQDGYYSKMYNIQIEDTGKEYNYTFSELVPIEETAPVVETAQTPETSATTPPVSTPPETEATTTQTPLDDVYDNTDE